MENVKCSGLRYWHSIDLAWSYYLLSVCRSDRSLKRRSKLSDIPVSNRVLRPQFRRKVNPISYLFVSPIVCIFDYNEGAVFARHMQHESFGRIIQDYDKYFIISSQMYSHVILARPQSAWLITSLLKKTLCCGIIESKNTCKTMRIFVCPREQWFIRMCTCADSGRQTARLSSAVCSRVCLAPQLCPSNFAWLYK